MSDSSDNPKVRLLLGALGGTVVFGSVLVLFALAVGDELGQSLVSAGWDGGALGLLTVLATSAPAHHGLALLGFSLFGGVIGVALAGRDARIRTEMRVLRRTREDLLDTLMRSERYATMGGMAAEIGHELNNYLAIARGQIELFTHAVGESVGEKAERYIESASSQLVRMQRICRGLMGFRGQRQSPVPCDLNDILRETVGFVSPLGRFDHVRFKMNLAPDLPPVLGDPQQMQQVFLNLFNNASDAMKGQSGRIMISTRQQARDGSVEVVVADEGRGIHPDLLNHVFQPGFTTRPDGHGYGLAICRRIVEQHGARLSVHSEPWQGTTFVLSMPSTVVPASELDPRPDAPSLPVRRPEEVLW